MKVIDFDKLVRTCHSYWIGALIVFGFLLAFTWLGLHYTERHLEQVSYTVTAQKSAEGLSKATKTP